MTSDVPVLVKKSALSSFYGAGENREEEALKLKEEMKSLMAGIEAVKGEVARRDWPW